MHGGFLVTVFGVSASNRKKSSIVGCVLINLVILTGCLLTTSVEKKMRLAMLQGSTSIEVFRVTFFCLVQKYRVKPCPVKYTGIFL